MKKSLVTVIFIFLSLWSLAQVQEQVSPTERKQQTAVTEPITLYKGFMRVGLGAAYGLIDKLFIDSKKESLPGNVWGSNFTVSLFVQYGISDRLMVDVLIPYANDNTYQSTMYELPFDFDEQYLYPQQWKTQGKGFGDIEFMVAYQLLQETISRPALAAFVTTTLPTGEKDILDDGDNNVNTFERPTGQGEIAVNTELRLRQVKYPFAYTAAVSYKYRTEASKILAVNEEAVKYHNGHLLRFSGSFNIHLNDWIAFKNVTDYVRIGQDSRNGEDVTEKGWVWQYSPGISFQLKKLRFDQTVTVPVKGKNVAADPGYLLTLQYTF